MQKMADGVGRDENIYLNFQLTRERARLAKRVREDKKYGRIQFYSINCNGRISIITNNGVRETVTPSPFTARTYNSGWLVNLYNQIVPEVPMEPIVTIETANDSLNL